MSPSRKNLMDKTLAVLRGEISGNRKAAEIALSVMIWQDTLDVILGTETSDEKLNEICTREIKAGLGID